MPAPGRPAVCPTFLPCLPASFSQRTVHGGACGNLSPPIHHLTCGCMQVDVKPKGGRKDATTTAAAAAKGTVALRLPPCPDLKCLTETAQVYACSVKQGVLDLSKGDVAPLRKPEVMCLCVGGEAHPPGVLSKGNNFWASPSFQYWD